jgi:hypothetical protein
MIDDDVFAGLFIFVLMGAFVALIVSVALNDKQCVRNCGDLIVLECEAHRVTCVSEDGEMKKTRYFK